MVIVFDLDDTLYDDRSYVLSGFKAVSEYLSTLIGIDKNKVFLSLVDELNKGRQYVFDRFLQKRKLYTKKLVTQCVSIYRKHNPEIYLYDDAKRCLDRFRDVPLYVVTDGNKLVQKNKCFALGLDSIMKKCLCTYAYGLKYSKPSPYCFLKICEWEKVVPNEVIYVADNPHKDFVGIKPLGFRTVRLRRGPHKDVFLGKKYEADVVIDSLDELIL